MRNTTILIAAVLLAVPAAASAGLGTSWYEGLSFNVGLSHVAEADSRIDGVHNREDNEGSIQTQNFDPKNDAGLSLGAEYLWPAGSGFVFGPGLEYDLPGTLERVYGNNMLKRRVSAQKEVYKDITTIPVYLTLGYHFKTRSALRPYLFGRMGYSFNDIGKYSMTLYEEGPMPLTGSPVEGAGANITRTSDVRDLEASPYYALGMGIRFNDRYSLQAMYSYTNIRFRVFYPTSYTYYNTASLTTVPVAFNVVEDHALNYSRVQLNMGYNFGGSTAEPVKEEKASLPRARNWRKGISLLVGLNDNIPMTSELTHINATVVNQYGALARSVQNVVSRPVQPVSASVGLECLFPASTHWDLGFGVMHNFKHDYEKVQTDSSGHYVQIRIEDFRSTVEYAAAKYYFETESGLEPYLVGRLGYSYNDFRYNKYSDETKMAGVSAADIKNGLYAAFGLGSWLSEHVFSELTYDVTKSGHKKPVYYGDSEEFKTTIQGIHFNLGYTFW